MKFYEACARRGFTPVSPLNVSENGIVLKLKEPLATGRSIYGKRWTHYRTVDESGFEVFLKKGEWLGNVRLEIELDHNNRLILDALRRLDRGKRTLGQYLDKGANPDFEIALPRFEELCMAFARLARRYDEINHFLEDEDGEFEHVLEKGFKDGGVFTAPLDKLTMQDNVAPSTAKSLRVSKPARFTSSHGVVYDFVIGLNGTKPADLSGITASFPISRIVLDSSWRRDLPTEWGLRAYEQIDVGKEQGILIKLDLTTPVGEICLRNMPAVGKYHYEFYPQNIFIGAREMSEPTLGGRRTLRSIEGVARYLATKMPRPSNLTPERATA